MLLKSVIIITIVIGCSVAIFFALSIFDVDDVLKVQITPYDCARTFDESSSLLETNRNSYNDRVADTIINLNFELMENRCYATVESWGYKSLYPDKVWGFGWEQGIIKNQHWLGEIDCKDTTCEKLKADIKKERETTLEVLKAKGMR